MKNNTTEPIEYHERQAIRKTIANELAKSLRISETEMQQMVDIKRQIDDLMDYRRKVIGTIVENNFNGNA